jgi:fumarate reductase subunit D
LDRGASAPAFRPGARYFPAAAFLDGEAPLESFLRWSDQPLVKLAESGLVFLLMVHMLGGLRLLVIENLDWRDEQKELATIAAGLSAVIAFILLARLF